ncbi:hypothetical protein D6445_11795 [Salmonella enterica subsp. enterica serovar Infantis]|nr:hypothetical protein [Salmonella enterica subsp. enterica serovar Infantis]
MRKNEEMHHGSHFEHQLADSGENPASPFQTDTPAYSVILQVMNSLLQRTKSMEINSAVLGKQVITNSSTRHRKLTEGVRS